MARRARRARKEGFGFPRAQRTLRSTSSLHDAECGQRPLFPSCPTRPDFNDVIARPERRERQLRRLPPRSVAVVAHGDGKRNGERLSHPIEQTGSRCAWIRCGHVDANLLVATEAQIRRRDLLIAGGWTATCEDRAAGIWRGRQC